MRGLLVVLGCGVAVLAGGLPAAPQGRAGLTTVFDSTRDTIVARVAGAVAGNSERRLVPVLTIAPRFDDTTSFTLTSEFDVDRRGFVWVYDNPTNTLVLYDSAGRKIRRIGRAGSGPGEFNGNGGMVVLPNGRVALWDPGNARINFYSPSGELVNTWRVRGGFGSSNNLVTDNSGAIYTKRPLYGRGSQPPRPGSDESGLVRYNEGGAFGDTLRPGAFHVPAVRYSASNGQGRFQTITVPNTPRSIWVWHPDGHFVLGDGGTGQILIARRNGKPIRIERIAPPVPISALERRTTELMLTAYLKQTDPSFSVRPGQLPSTKPFIEDILISRDGRIWVEVPTPSERIPEDQLPAPRAGEPPLPPQFRAQPVREVFSSSGVFLGRVRLPMGASLIHAEGNVAWVLAQDGDGLQQIVRMRIEPPL